MTGGRTDLKILAIAEELLAAGGPSAVSFDAIAARLGRSKQAVLYWFPTKRDLLAAMFVPWLEAEVEVAEAALADVVGRDAAITAFVHSVARFHLEDLNRFRMMYLAPQITGVRAVGRGDRGAIERVHPITDRLYTALAAKLDGTPPERRRAATAIHAAVLGLILMIALSNAVHDPLKHGSNALVEALVASLVSR